jgi:hypothetical protein
MEIIFCKREVYIHEKSSTNQVNDEVKVGGQIQVIKNVRFLFFHLIAFLQII